MPYTEEKIFEENSIALYAKTREGWDYLESKINKENKTITANITDIANYLDNESKAVFAVMGVLCTFCTNSSLELIYEPVPKSKDAIIMVHGFASSPATYQEIIDEIRITNQPFTVFTFGYPSSKSLDEVADEFSALTEAKSAEFDNIYIVAHSTGGLITQQALYSAYNKNYSYAQKTRKLILVGVPNEGAPVFEVYQDLFKKLINQRSEFSLFNLNSKIIDELAEGKIVPRVPGIKYYVIAGTRQYALNLLFYKATSEKVLGTYNISDGIVTLESAQHIGEGLINDKCDNYWEVNLTHMNLIDDPVARKIIEKVIAEEILGKELTLMGYNKYFDLKITDCNKNEKYVVIGKKIAEEKFKVFSGSEDDRKIIIDSSNIFKDSIKILFTNISNSLPSLKASSLVVLRLSICDILKVI